MSDLRLIKQLHKFFKGGEVQENEKNKCGLVLNEILIKLLQSIRKYDYFKIN